jgi:hypothetical protein
VVVDLAQFKTSLAAEAPAGDVAAPLAGLWWTAKGDWDRAHRIVQDESTREAAWVHAHLHRLEGDLGNAPIGIGRPGSLSRTMRLSWNGSGSHPHCLELKTWE